MYPLPLGKGDLKMKNDFWGLISIAGGYLGIPQFLNIHHKYVSSFYEVFEIAPQRNIII